VRISRKLLAGAAGLALLTGFNSQAMAATETGTLSVSATITSACSIGDGTLSFGNLAGITANGDGTASDASDVDATASSQITYVCTNGTSAAITGTSVNYSASDHTWHMKSGDNDVAYLLYSDAGKTQLFDDQSGNDIAVTGTGTPDSITLYGTIAGSELNKPIGAYTDTVTLTITYS
jgi:spore coat protein U-like protein